ncbi:MAG: tryptophan--tRNA ligase [Candidatus Micrarchaeales archaeon]
MGKKFTVTPWEVEGEIDYDKLIKEFGLTPINEDLLKRIEKLTGELHFLLKRKIFFAHRDLDWLLDKYEKGEKFFLYTGRGPSGEVHLGHLLPWIFTKWLQDKFKVKLYFQITDDEKFLFKKNLSLEDTKRFSYENILDIIALGFDPKNTFIFLDTEYSKTLYPQAIKVAKHLTFSTVKATFGFNNETNIGSIFYTSIQAVPAFLESVKEGKNIPCLIPLGVDQDPHFRLARDVLPKLGYYKPALIHSKLFPSLLGPNAKMSASQPNTAIFTTDDEKSVEKKIANAFTGGAVSIKEQKEKGGNPDVCSVYKYYYFLFEKDDKKLKEIYENCKSGKLLCGECKKMLAEKIKSFLKEHQKEREKAKDKIEKFMLRD